MRTNLLRRTVAIFPAALLLTISPAGLAQEAQPPAPAAATEGTAEAPKIPAEQLDSLVAPIALFPDPLLAQTLAASTYPIEIMQLHQWLEQNKTLKDKALVDAVQKQSWDPSVQAMATFPDVVKRMMGNIQWTSDMGNAFLSQQADVLDAVQRMRAKAQGNGALQTGEQQKVETKTVGGEQVIIVEQASPTTVYVPSYDPAVVYGPPPAAAYPYPTSTYPGYVPGAALAFGTGLVLGAAANNNNWGWGCGWDSGDIDVNVNNNYVSNYNKQNNIQGGGSWQHNAQHRGNAPYGNQTTANRYGGRTAGGAGGVGGAGRPGGAGGVGGVGGAGRPGGAGGVGGPGGAGGIGGAGKPGGVGGVGGAGRPGGAGGAGGIGGAGKPGGAGGIGGAGKPGGAGGVGSAGGVGGAGGAGRPGGAGGVGSAGGVGGAGGAGRPGGAGGAGGARPGGGGGDKVGGRSLDSKPAARGGDAFGGGSGSQARASSSRGGQSMGGGGSRGGGGGGSRGGGGGGGGRGGGGGGGGGGRRR